MTEPVINEAMFRELQDTAGADFVADLVGTFLEEAPGLLAELRAARSGGDAERFRRAAHSLKSNGLTFGAVTLAGLARALELQGLGADAASDVAAIDKIDAALSEAAAALKALCHE